MAREFRLARPAIGDLKQIVDYISVQSGLTQAERFLTKADHKFAKIARFPNLGRLRPAVLPGMRSTPLDRYLILYTVSETSVDILRVVSGYRDLQALFDDAAGDGDS
jgi:toxin ParE1/3/4